LGKRRRRRGRDIGGFREDPVFKVKKPRRFPEKGGGKVSKEKDQGMT